MTQSSLRGAAAVAVLFGPTMVTALYDVAELTGVGVDWPGIPLRLNVPALSLTAAGVWLLLRAHHRARVGAQWRAAGVAIVGPC
ncbi:hypothetical protein AB0C84_40145 [Actinomadura sp. NPDC048955]|uniref:hypothetical protein n=1 Tax=Actinomadura sp. NPDC048955 TaxID=3158228 RepID=UPI0033F8C92B